MSSSPSEFAVLSAPTSAHAPGAVIRMGLGADASVATVTGPPGAGPIHDPADFLVLLADLLRPGWVDTSTRAGPDIPRFVAVAMDGASETHVPRVIRRRAFTRASSAVLGVGAGDWHVALGTATGFDEVRDLLADTYRWSALHDRVFPRFATPPALTV